MRKMPANEVFYSIFEWPEGGEKMAHFRSLLCFYIKKIPGNLAGARKKVIHQKLHLRHLSGGIG